MNVWGWLTGGAKSAEKGLDAIINTGDALFYTKEEQAADTMEFVTKRQELWLKMQELINKESTPRSVNRRIVAWGVIFISIFITIYLMVVATVEYFVVGQVVLVLMLLDMIVALKWPIALVSVIVFYFGPHGLSALMSGFGAKK